MTKQPKTFIELYRATKKLPTPAKDFIRDICNITGSAESTVRMWICGAQMPSAPARKLIAKHFGARVEELFPDTKNL